MLISLEKYQGENLFNSVVLNPTWICHSRTLRSVVHIWSSSANNYFRYFLLYIVVQKEKRQIGFGKMFLSKMLTGGESASFDTFGWLYQWTELHWNRFIHPWENRKRKNQKIKIFYRWRCIPTWLPGKDHVQVSIEMLLKTWIHFYFLRFKLIFELVGCFSVIHFQG